MIDKNIEVEKWERFYKKNELFYPDENLIRIFRGPYLDIAKEGRLLDVGFGSGAFLEFAASDFECYGEEINQESINQLKRRAADRNLSINTKLITNEYLAYDDDFFDVVVSWNAVYYWGNVSKVKKAISEMYRVLRPGGTFLLSVPAERNSIANRLSPTEEMNVYKVSEASTYDTRQGVKIVYGDTLFWQALMPNFKQVKKGRVTIDLFLEDKISDWLLFGCIK